jgi:tetratricopeptide (TPR) repeat protein
VALLDTGRVREAFPPLDRALEVAQTLDVPDVLAAALTFKAQLSVAVGRIYEARILFDGAVELCQQHELSNQLVSAQVNSGDFLLRFDLPGSAERSQAAMETARRIGNRYYESIAAANLMQTWLDAGQWDDLQRLGAELLGQADDRPTAEILHFELGIVAALRGDIDAARAHLARMAAWSDSQNNQLRWLHAACRATISVSAGEFADALDVVGRELEQIVKTDGASSHASRVGFPAAIRAALLLGRLADAEELLSLLSELPPGQMPPYVRAQLSHSRGLVAAARGEAAAAESELRAAIDGFGSLGFPYWLASAQTELADLLVQDNRVSEARPLLDEARLAFGRLGAAPALERVEAILAREGTFSLQTGRATGRE